MMNEVSHGDRVRIDEYGGDQASRNDRLFNGATGTVDTEVNPSVYYINVVLDGPVTTSTGKVRSSVLCIREELTVI